MRLSYRGVEYEPELTSTETIDSGMKVQYRGQSYSVRYPRHIPTQPVHTLNYRGVTYATMPNGTRMSIPGGLQTENRQAENLQLDGQPTRFAVDMASIGSRFQRVQQDDLELVHRQNIRRRLMQRIQSAQQRGDQLLLQQLEQEMNLFV